jgi:hypothetical protein
VSCLTHSPKWMAWQEPVWRSDIGRQLQGDSTRDSSTKDEEVELNAGCPPGIYTASTLGGTHRVPLRLLLDVAPGRPGGILPCRLFQIMFCGGRAVCETHHTFVVRGARHVRVVITEFVVDSNIGLGEPSAVRFLIRQIAQFRPSRCRDQQPLSASVRLLGIG